jgi:hypothetical protein
VNTRLLTAIVLGCALSACASGGMNAVVDTFQSAVWGESRADASRLNPSFRYLRVTREGRVVFLALGNLDRHPLGPIEVWYSAQKEVLRLQNGRLVGATGLTTEWREVVLPELPSWSAIAGAGQPLHWARQRDVMPGYRYGMRDSLTLRVTAAPEKSTLVGVDPGSLTWFEELRQAPVTAGYLAAVLPSSHDDLALSAARYAVDFRDGQETVVYGEQCLARDLCFTWQRWSAVKP